MAQCFFCGQDERLTRAHLFQSQFRDAVDGGFGTVSLSASGVAARGINRDLLFQGDIRTQHVTSLCKKCNNDWMNRIECAAAPGFESIMQNKGLPSPPELFKLAHWSTVLGILSSELHPVIEIPAARRYEVRYTPTGQPVNYATFFIWTRDYFPSLQSDFFRVVSDDSMGDDSVHWFHVLHAGPIVLVSTSPFLVSRIAKVLGDKGVQSVLGALSSNLVYVPPGLVEACAEGTGMPSHSELHDLLPTIVNSGLQYVETRGSQVIDLTRGLEFKSVDFSFDFEDRLRDVRDQLDLKYLEGLFSERMG